MTDSPRINQNWSEHYRLAAKEWVELDGAARLLEESKTAVLAQKIAALGDMPHNKAEREVKASDEWQEYIERMVTARTKANLAKAKSEYTRMKFKEAEARAFAVRSEMSMSR